MSNPFAYVNTINANDRKSLNELGSKGYNAFMVNRAFSQFIDTIAIANEMNSRSALDSDMQMAYYINTVRKKKRFAKWNKSEKNDDLEAVSQYFSYSYERALEALSILSDEDLNEIKKQLVKGGKNAK